MRCGLRDTIKYYQYIFSGLTVLPWANGIIIDNDIHPGGGRPYDSFQNGLFPIGMLLGSLVGDSLSNQSVPIRLHGSVVLVFMILLQRK